MIVGWIKNIIGQGAQAFEKKAKSRLTSNDENTEELSLSASDASVSEAMPLHDTRATHQKSSELMSMIRRGGAQADNMRLNMNVKRHVKKNLADFYVIDDLMEEVTEKIVEAAKEDERLRKLFR